MPDPATMLRMRCVNVVDGDTAWFEQADYAAHKVRFIGIDTPETVHPSKPEQAFGPEASEYTTDRLLDQMVYLERDIEEHDHYGRFLFYIWLEDGTLLNWDLVRQGYATVTTYPPNVKYVDYFIQAQERARTEGLGLWSTSPLNQYETQEVTP